MSLVETLKIIVLGIVEGFTEILVDEIIRLDQPEAFKEMFLVVIQLGAILAVAVMYFHRLNPFSPSKNRRQREATWALWIKIIIACIPAAVLGLLLVAAMLILYGILFIVLENSPITSSPSIQKVGQISVKTGFLIGVFQLLSLIPGTSRSGSTILGAMILGCSRSAAAEFSFFLGIPVMFGASFLKIVKFFLDGNSFTGSQIFYTLLGMAVAFGVSVYSIQFLMSYVRRHNFKFFGYYRIILGAIVLAYFGITALAV